MTLIEKITDCRNRYEAITEIIDSGDGPSVFGQLVAIRKELSCLAYDLGLVTGEAVKMKIGKKSRREISFLLKQQDLMDNQKVKVTAAEAQAKQSVTELMKEEAEKEADYQYSNIILKQLNELIFSVKQDISIIRKEHESFNAD